MLLNVSVSHKILLLEEKNHWREKGWSLIKKRERAHISYFNGGPAREVK